MQSLSSLNRDQLSQVIHEAAWKIEKEARLEYNNSERRTQLFSIVSQGRDLSNFCCECRFTLKRLRAMVGDYLKKAEAL